MPTRQSKVLGAEPRIGLSARFRVTVDGLDLGGWSSCKGLAVNFDCEELETGGNYEHTFLLPKRLKYSNITLSRAMTAEGTATVHQWLRDIAGDWMHSYEDDYTPNTATITLLDSSGQTAVHCWTLKDVYPRAWKGPDLDADSTKVAIETLELAHHGFL
ncbi:phage tail protein [Kitasatospora sp. NPDC101176]|uniref:phage tail protein n=1 Tax=Kitasatospora sp. NPDC101176 TaxID=3364099 RepID=UPI00380607AF